MRDVGIEVVEAEPQLITVEPFGKSACLSAVETRMVAQGFLTGVENTMVQAIPPGFSAWNIARNPLPGSGKNIRPSRQIAASKLASSTFRFSPSAA